MRSGELADLAGVTVRTLRHYHQIGLLPEPRRGVNGYRDYTVHDLIALLRVRRLAELGIPLDGIPDLDSTPGAGDAALDALDAELVAQIARLEARRAVIASLRSDGASLDLPPQFAPFARTLTAHRAADAADIERDLFVLLSHLSGPAHEHRLLALVERLTEIGDAPGVRAMQLRFDELPADAPEDQRSSLTADYLDVYAAFFGAVGEAGPLVVPPVTVRLIAEYTGDRLNQAQLDVLGRVEAALDAG